MKISMGSLGTRTTDATEGRVVVGTMIVIASVLVLPVPVWLVVLAIALATRPRDEWREPRGPRPALRRWLLVSLLFVGSIVLTMFGKPLTGHGAQLLIWFTLLPAIGVLFWLQGRRVHTIPALWAGATMAACTAGIVAVVQVGVVGDQRATGVVANSITFGNLSLVFAAVSVALHRLLDLPRRTALVAALTAAALGVTASVLSGSRGGWLAAPLLIALLLWQARGELNLGRIGRLAMGLTCALALANAISDGMPTSRASASVANVSGYQPTSPRSESAGSSEGARIEAWRSSADAFTDRPITGVGWGNLGAHFDRDAALGVRHERIATFDHAHNQLLGAAANGGLVGVLTTLALFAVPFVGFARAMRSGDRRRETLGLTGVAVLGSYATFGLTESVLENLAPVTILAVLVAALCSELDSSGGEPSDSAESRVIARPRSAWWNGSESRRPVTPVAYRWVRPHGLHS